MRKKWRLFMCITTVFCLSVILVTGCGTGKDEEPDDVKTEEQDKTAELETDETEQTDNSEEGDGTPTSDSIQTRTVTVYYVDNQSAEVTGKSVEIQDEYDIWDVFKESSLLTENCELLSLKVNDSEKKMELDFNSATGDRIRSMGTAGETQIIGCIVNTYLEAYGCDGIRLTEEGQTLETSHGADFSGYSGSMTF